MPNPLALIPLTVDSEDVQRDDLTVFLEIKRGLNENPQVRGVDVVIPHLAGRVAGSREDDLLPIELVGIVCADETIPTLAGRIADFRDNVEWVKALFDSKVTVVLEATLENGDVATINARPLTILSNQRNAEVDLPSITLESIDPAWVITPGS